MADAELEAMGKVLAALADLEPPVRARVIRWINEKLDLLPLLDAATQQDNEIKTRHASNATPAAADGAEGKFDVSLASHIRGKGADGSQTQRFLVTSDWLRRRGQSNLTSGAIAKALTENQQARLANPADCLNKNVAKGFCEKTKDGFFITPEGLRELGYK
jgi:hypothetical protein